MRRARMIGFFVLLLMVWLLAACGNGETAVSDPDLAEDVAEVADVEMEEEEPEPTATAVLPTETPEPTNTPTAEPTNTPTPEPTATAIPTEEPDEEATRPPKPTSEPEQEPDSKADDEADERETGGETAVDLDETDPLDLIIQSEQTMERLDSVRFNQLVSVTFSEALTQTINQSCQIERAESESSYCLSEIAIVLEGNDPIVGQNEVVAFGDEEMWQRELPDGEWTQLSPDAMAEAGLAEEGFAGIRISDFVVDAQIVGETQINGNDVVEISFDFDVGPYFAAILGEELEELFATAESQEGQGTMWLGIDRVLPYRLEVNMAMVLDGETIVMSTQATYFGFNEPVEFPDPTADE